MPTSIRTWGRPTAALLLAAAGFGVWVLQPQRAAADTTINIVGANGDQSYSPASVSIAPGTTVSWYNRDASPRAPHNAFCGGPPDCPQGFSSGSPVQGPNAAGSYTFQYSGAYTYHCAVHPSMTGHITVTGNVTPPAQSGPGPSSSAASSSAVASAAAASGVAQSRNTTVNAGGAGAPAGGGGTGQPEAVAQATDDTSTFPPISVPAPQVRAVAQQAVTHAATTPWWVLLPVTVFVVLGLVVFVAGWMGPIPLTRRRPREDRQ